MSLLTGRELEFLTSLRTSWKRLYRNELARLLKDDANEYDAAAPGRCRRPAIHTLKRPDSEPVGQILAFRPHFKCDRDPSRPGSKSV